MLLDRIRAQQPGSADAGKNVDVAHAEHNDRNAVDQRSSGKARLGERVFKRLEWRLARGSRHLIAVGLTHMDSDGRYVLIDGRDNPNINGQLQRPA